MSGVGHTVGAAGAPDLPDLSLGAGHAGTAGPAGVVLAPRIEGYEVTGCLGHGGMGTVWRATQISTRRSVALKVMAERLFGSDKARQRFEREVELAARLDHPGIAQVYDSGLSRGLYYYAMEFIDGVPLDAFVAAHGLGPRKVLELMGAVCDAVEHAHSRGVIHRDLKPSNILVSPDGRPHVLDFGLAKALSDAASGGPGAAGARGVTRDGEITGTLAYMPPEQAAGRQDQVSTASDVYSLGAMLYEVLLGRPPHEVSGSDLATARRIIEEDPRRPRQIDPGFSRELESLLLKALAPEPERRYASAGALGRDIGNFLRNDPLEARAPTVIYFLSKRIRRYRGRVTVAAVVFVLLVALVVTAWWRVAAERNRALGAEAAEHQQRQLAQASAVEARQRLAAALVTQGMAEMDRGDPSRALPWLSQALRSDADDANRLWADRVRMGTALRQMPRLRQMWDVGGQGYRAEFVGGSKLVMTVTRDGRGQFWDVPTATRVGAPMALGRIYANCLVSTDGTRLLAWGGKTMRVFAIPAGAQVGSDMEHESNIRAAALSPAEGRVFTITEDGTARVWDWTTGRVVATTSFRGELVGRGLLSADGLHLTTCSIPTGDTGPALTVRVWDVRTAGVVKTVSEQNGMALEAIQDPRGRLVVLLVPAAGPLTKAWWVDGTTGQLVALPSPFGDTPGDMRFSRGGRYLLRREDNRVRVLDLATLAVTSQVTVSADMNGGLSIFTASDDRWLMLENNQTTAQFWDLRGGADAAFATTPPLAHRGMIAARGVSSDGKLLLTFTSQGVVRLWAPGAQEAAPPVLDPEPRVGNAAFSSDGKCVLTWSAYAGARLWDARTRQPISPRLDIIAGDSLCYSVLSPDGHLLADFLGSGHVHVCQMPGGEAVLARTLGPRETSSFGGFTPDSKTLVCLPRFGGVIFIDARTGATVAPTIAANKVRHYDLSPDGRRIALLGQFQGQAGGAPGMSWGVWDIASGRNIVQKASESYVRGPVFSDDGRAVLFTDTHAGARWFDAQSGSAVPRTWAARTVMIRDSSAPQNVLIDHGLMVKREYQAVRAWDLANNQAITPPLGVEETVISAAISPDHRMIATGSNSAARVWETGTALPLTPLLRTGTMVDWMGFSPARPQLLIDARTSVRLVDLEADERPVETLTGLAEMLSGARVGKVGSPETLTTPELMGLWRRFGDKQ